MGAEWYERTMEQEGDSVERKRIEKMKSTEKSTCLNLVLLPTAFYCYEEANFHLILVGLKIA